MYQITAIQSAYLHVGRLANELMHSAVVPIEGVQSVPIPIGEDGKPDLKNILDQVRRNTERINTAFTVYGSSVLTVGILAKAIGTDVVSLGTGWPETSGPQLYVCSGRKEERDAAEELLANWAGPYVTDLLTVTELVRSECEDVLSLVAPLYISQSASDTVSSLVHSAEQDPNSAYLSERDGEFTFTDNTSAMRSHRLEFIRKVRFCVDKYCIPSPAYGPETVPAEIRNIGHHLDGGSFDFLLLSLEQKALGITLDGRLRELAAQIGKIEGIWPQVLMLKALNKKTISHAIYSYAVIQALASRRTHVSLGANEIWWCLQQAPSLLQSSMRVVKQHLLDPKVEGESALLTVLELLQIVLRTPAQLGAICEISEHMFAAVFAHPSVDATSAHALATQRLSEILGAVFASVNRGWVEQSLAAPKLESWKNQVERSLGRARELSRKSKEEIIALPLRVVSPFCFRVPRLIFTGPESIKTSLE